MRALYETREQEMERLHFIQCEVDHMKSDPATLQNFIMENFDEVLADSEYQAASNDNDGMTAGDIVLHKFDNYCQRIAENRWLQH